MCNKCTVLYTRYVKGNLPTVQWSLLKPVSKYTEIVNLCIFKREALLGMQNGGEGGGGRYHFSQMETCRGKLISGSDWLA